MAKKVITFTQARIRDLPIPDTGRVEYYDTKKTNLMCRVSSTGHKSFAVVKWQGGKMQRVTIGDTGSVTVNFAQNEHDGILTLINSGTNPTAEKRKNEAVQTKLAEVLELYLLGRDLKPYTIKNYRYKLQLGFNDWLKLPVNKITKDMVEKRFQKISKERGKTTANTTMRVLRLTLNYAKAKDMIPDSLTTIVKLHKSNRKDRIIPSKQLQAWHEAVEALPNQKAKVYLLMALYMGFRSTELLNAQWSHVDIKAKTITLHDTKNGTNHQLPMPTLLMPYIKDLKTITGDHKWLFEGDKAGQPMTTPIKPIKAVIKASGVEFSPHDCRRTFATIAEAVNLPMSMIKRLMNHVTTSDVTGGYIVTEEETLKQAINKIADYIQSRVTQKDNVIQLHG